MLGQIFPGDLKARTVTLTLRTTIQNLPHNTPARRVTTLCQHWLQKVKNISRSSEIWKKQLLFRVFQPAL